METAISTCNQVWSLAKLFNRCEIENKKLDDNKQKLRKDGLSSCRYASSIYFVKLCKKSIIRNYSLKTG